MSQDPRMTPEMAAYWREQYAEWSKTVLANDPASPYATRDRYIQSLRACNYPAEVVAFVVQSIK